MFEKFTDRARRAVVLAQEHARLHSHSTIEVRHLLAGVYHEGEALGRQAMDAVRITVADVDSLLEPDGQHKVVGHITYSDEFRALLAKALHEALRLECPYVATEHLLLAAIDLAPNAVEWLADPERLRRAVIKLIEDDASTAQPVVPDPLTTDEHRFMELTGELSRLGSKIIGDGPQAKPDWAEFAMRVHSLQHMVLRQAACRAYPDLYRLLGQTIPKETT